MWLRPYSGEGEPCLGIEGKISFRNLCVVGVVRFLCGEWPFCSAVIEKSARLCVYLEAIIVYLQWKELSAGLHESWMLCVVCSFRLWLRCCIRWVRWRECTNVCVIVDAKAKIRKKRKLKVRNARASNKELEGEKKGAKHCVLGKRWGTSFMVETTLPVAPWAQTPAQRQLWRRCIAGQYTAKKRTKIR